MIEGAQGLFAQSYRQGKQAGLEVRSLLVSDDLPGGGRLIFSPDNIKSAISPGKPSLLVGMEDSLGQEQQRSHTRF